MTSTSIRAKSPLDRFVAATLKRALVVFGLATCLPILLTIDIGLGNRVLFRGGLETTLSVKLIMRHWGFMIFGVGVLMIAAALLPWLRFATLTFAAAEKILLVAMVVAGLSQPWGRDYLTAGLLDRTIVVYCVLYFLNSHGRPGRWVPAPEFLPRQGRHARPFPAPGAGCALRRLRGGPKAGLIAAGPFTTSQVKPDCQHPPRAGNERD